MIFFVLGKYCIFFLVICSVFGRTNIDQSLVTRHLKAMLYKVFVLFPTVELLGTGTTIGVTGYA